MSALSRLSGIDFDMLSDTQKRQINMIPAMIYHRVQSEEGVLLRMNSVARTIAEPLASLMKESVSKENCTLQDHDHFYSNLIFQRGRKPFHNVHLYLEKNISEFGKYLPEKRDKQQIYRGKRVLMSIKFLEVEG